MPEVQTQEMQSTYLLSSIWRPVRIGSLPALCALHEQSSRVETSFCDRVLVNAEHVADPALSVMAQLHALVANPMTRYVRTESTRSLTRQSSDQGELRLEAY